MTEPGDLFNCPTCFLLAESETVNEPVWVSPNKLAVAGFRFLPCRHSHRPAIAGLEVGNDCFYQWIRVGVCGSLGQRGTAGKRFLQKTTAAIPAFMELLKSSAHSPFVKSALSAIDFSPDYSTTRSAKAASPSSRSEIDNHVDLATICSAMYSGWSRSAGPAQL